MNSADTTIEEVLFDSLSIGILLFDGQGDLVKTNACATEFLSRVCPETIILSLGDFNKAFNASETKPAGAVEKFEVNVDNMFFAITISAASVQGNVFTIIQMRDISGEKKQIGLVHRQTSDLLWKIRSRITPVQNALTLLIDYGVDIETSTELVRNSQFEIGELERNLDNFRDLSLIMAGALEQSLMVEKTGLHSIVETAIAHTKVFRNFIGKKCSIINATDKDILICADKQRTSRIVESLLFNAIIYSGESVTIQISANRHDDELTVEVKDDGFGIPDGDQPNIFSYSFRGKNSTRTDYCGMGCELFIARQVLAHMNASLSFSSRENEGTTFTVHFHQKAKP